MIFREMSRKIDPAPRVAAEEAKKRKDQHEDSDEALVDARRRLMCFISQGKRGAHRRRASCA